MAGFFLKPREFQDRLDLVPHVDRFQPHRRPAKKDVLAYGCLAVEAQRHVQQRLAAAVHAHPAGGWRIDAVEYSKQCRLPGAVTRSEEHTSELQSLMRISYAVFCLKKKKHILIYLTDKINTMKIQTN